MRHDDPPPFEQLGALENAGEKLELRELDGLVDALEDGVEIGARVDELGGEPERLRSRVRVLEAAGVGDERDVERLRELRRQRHPELGENIPKHLSGRRRVGDDEVDVAEAGVVVVMVDIERERRASDGLGVADSMLARAVDGDEDTLACVGRRLAHKLGERHEAVLVRQRGARGEVHHDVLAERAESERSARAASRAHPRPGSRA